MTGSFEKPVLHAGHQVLFVLKQITLIGNDFLKVLFSSFSFDDAIYEIRWRNLSVN